MRTIKESSDELNPSVVTTAFIGRAPRRKSARDYVALAVATCGVGYMPVAPGTWGSAVGVGLFLIFRQFSDAVFPVPPLVEKNIGSIDAIEKMLRGVGQALLWRTSLLLVLIVAVTLIGVWAATRAEPLLGRKDPGAVVIDEVAGQLMTFLFVPFDSGAWAIVAGFVAFRVFDIWKPYPIRRLEALESGLGIMADDVLAGAYAAALMSLLISIHLIL